MEESENEGISMMELLAPAGSMEALLAAVQNGADAVYLGAGAFNARMGAKNFTDEELQEAISYCHIRGVKVHLTLNTIASDRELPQVEAMIRSAAQMGVDAFIVQDLGIVSLCRETAPGIPVHASTQMSIHSLAGVEAAAALGVSRVVLARELPRAELIQICRNSPVEIEVFVHGALCMCYSGQCYFSGVVGGRSGNRGQCAQPCRLPYGYGRFEDRYPLSLRDNCLISYLRELNTMGVRSLKIEGRAKRPEYVATAVRIFRSVLDGAEPTEQDLRDLGSVFSRQGFTQGYYLGKTGPQMFGTRQEGREDRALFSAARASYEAGELPRVPVRFYALIRKGEPALLAAEDPEGNTCRTEGAVPQTAVNRPLTEESLCERLRKTGGTPYYFRELRGQIEAGLTLSAAQINEMRRDVLSELSTIRGRQPEPILHSARRQIRFPGQTEPPALTVSVLRAEQITDAVLKARPAVLYVPVSELLENRGLPAMLSGETELCAVLPRVVWDSEQTELERQLGELRAMGVSSVLAGNLGHFRFAAARGFRVRGDFGLNLYNSRSMLVVRQLGLTSALCSFEMTLPQIRDLSKAVPTELLAYGRLPLMLTQNCVIRNRTGACSCSGSPTRLVDRRGESFPVVRDPGTCRSVILNGRKLYLLDKQRLLASLGLWAIRLQFTTENPAEVTKVMRDYRNAAPFDPAGCTRGLYQRGV